MSRTVDEYMKLSYRMEIYPDAVEGGYTVAFPDLPGCLTCAETLEKAIENSEDAKRCWFEAAIEDGVQINEPDDLLEYSSKLTLRVPKSLHRELAKQAGRENVSINQYCVYLLSKNNALRAADTEEKDQLDMLLDLYREKMITTETLVFRAEARGVLDDLIDRISEEETPNVAQKFFDEWDPDFTKLTPSEKKRMEEAEADKETVPHDDIDWN